MKGTKFRKALSCFVAVYMVITCNMPAMAFAAESASLKAAPVTQLEAGGQGLAAQDGETGVITGGNQTVSKDGTYSVAADATGYVIIEDGIEVELVGPGMDTVIKDLNVVIGEGSTVTIRDLHEEMSTKESNPLFDISGAGVLNIEGTNLLDNSSGSEPNHTNILPAVICVGPGADAVFGGSGVLYGYKNSLGAFIGSTADNMNGSQPSGKMTFVGGTWLLKGTQTGPAIGNDSSSQLGGDITINGGQLYVRVVARGAGIGGSANGMGANVILNGGLVESYVEWQGSAVGYGGGKKTAGSLTVNGGSLKPIVGRNGYNAWGIDGAATTANVTFCAAAVTSDHETAPLAFDTSAYAGSDIQVKVDGSDFYNGPASYAYTSSQLKNPTNAAGGSDTMINWVENTAANKTEDSDSTTNGSPLAGETTLYFWLSKEAHTVAVGDDVFAYEWDDAAGEFVEVFKPDTSWYSASETSFTLNNAAQLSGLAQIVNGTAEGIAQDSFEGKTVALGADIALNSEDWTPIGTATDAFAGTFDGAGHAITGLAITSSEGGYRGLFGNNAGTVGNFTIAGSLGTEDATIGGGDCYAAAVAYNTGTVSDVISSATLYIGQGSTWAVGGVVARNDGGTVMRCGFDGTIACDTSKDIRRVGGVVGHLTAGGTISECYNKGDVEAWNYRNGCEGTGGVLGSLDSEGTVVNCYSTGVIRNGKGDSNTGGKQGTGGIVGSINAGDVMNCYATGYVYGPASTGVLIGKVGNGAYTNLYTLDTARSYNQYNTLVDEELNLKYADGTCENEDGTIKFGGAAIGNSYNSGYTISNSYTKSADDLKASPSAIGFAFHADPENINDGFPVLYWEIGAPLYDLADCDIASIGNQAYTGSAIEPAIEITYGEDATPLVEGVDYALTFEDNVKIGMAKVTITGMGAFEDSSAEKTFKIVGLITDCTIAPIEDQAYTGSPVKPQVSVTFAYGDGETVDLVQGADFQVLYLSNTSIGQARAMVVGTGFFTGVAKTTFNIVGAGYSIMDCTIADVPAQGYTGQEVQPELVVTNPAGDQLVQGTDFQVLFFDNVEVGEATATIIGDGDYEGMLSTTFAISPSWERVAGNNRWATMAAIVEKAFPETSEYAVIANGENFPDALSASALAGAYKCPVITTKAASLSNEARAELERLGVKSVFIVGGASAVSNAASEAIAALNGGITVTRVAGSDRQSTSTAVFDAIKKGQPSFGGIAIVVNGWSYADALSISPWAYANSAPIMLARPSKEAKANNPAGLTAAQVNAIAASCNKVVIVGGKSAVPESVETALVDAGISAGSITRLEGNDRYGTSLAVANWALENGSNVEHPVVATGKNFPDALAGAALCGSHNSIMVLADQGANNGEAALAALTANKASLIQGCFLGGTGAVSADSAASIAEQTDSVLLDPLK